MDILLLIKRCRDDRFFIFRSLHSVFLSGKALVISSGQVAMIRVYFAFSSSFQFPIGSIKGGITRTDAFSRAGVSQKHLHIGSHVGQSLVGKRRLVCACVMTFPYLSHAVAYAEGGAQSPLPRFMTVPEGSMSMFIIIGYESPKKSVSPE